MEKTSAKYVAYSQILTEELIPAMGCTEPVALAYAAAKCRGALGALPDGGIITVSGNIIKNVKSVIVPNTGGLKGIEASVAAGIVAGDASRALEVVSGITDAQKPLIKEYMNTHQLIVRPFTGDAVFYIEIELYSGTSRARAIIETYHTNIVLLEKDGVALFKAGAAETADTGLTDRSLMNVADIVDFANSVDIDDVRPAISRQIAMNSAISAEGLANPWGAQIGRILRKSYGNDVKIRARAAAAAGSDARMGGCELPVVIVSGSGNQGMTASLPVIEFAKQRGCCETELYRALVVSNLITIHQKTGIGRLSAFCGAVSAGCGAGAGIAYLCTGSLDAISHTVVNALAILSGMVCDGAKPSCAAKISAAVDAGIMGYCMYNEGQGFCSGDGIITEGVDQTITNVGRMAREGMRETDREILKIMVGDK